MTVGMFKFFVVCISKDILNYMICQLNFGLTNNYHDAIVTLKVLFVAMDKRTN